MTFKDKILVYLLQRSDIADNQYNDTLHHFRYHSADEVDYLELIIKKARKDVYAEILRDLLNLLKI